jgi:hypothetical protein
MEPLLSISGELVLLAAISIAAKKKEENSK